MRVALVHDYIKEYGGAERVLEALHEMYPDADVYTSVYLPEFLGPHRERFKDWKIKTSWFQHVPFNHKLISPFRLLSAWTFSRFDLSEYDVVIVSATGAYFPNAIKTKPHPDPLLKGEGDTAQNNSSLSEHSESNGSGEVQICYCHTPPRYLYGYATAREWKKNKIFAFLAGIANHFLRIVDFNASRNVDYYIANSEEVASRIKKFYRRDAMVIYPPVELQGLGARGRGLEKNKKTSPYNLEPRFYYLTGGRLARAKHVDIIVRACSELEVPLKVFGRGFAGYEEELEKIANSRHSGPPTPVKQAASLRPAQNLSKAQHSTLAILDPARMTGSKIEFLGEVSDQEKSELMAGAMAFIFASEDEDFGIVPVEAMAHGLPVIAHRSGGVKETVLEGRTGVFFDKLTVASLKEAIQKFEKLTIDPKACRKQAEKFSKERFVKEIKAFVSVRKM